MTNQTSPQKSEAHLAFFGKFEYFQVGIQVYRAHIAKPVMPDGHRAGRWECPVRMWPEVIATLKAFLTDDFNWVEV